jgi:phage I-like protein
MNKMFRVANNLIINAEQKDLTRVCIAKIGEWKGHPMGDYKLTDRDLEEIIANFDKEGRPLLFDYDHESLWGKSAAAGWGSKLEIENGMIYCTVEWTPGVEDQIKNKVYRYFSNVLWFNYFDPNNAELSGTYLGSVALTNTPFQKDLPPIKNSFKGGNMNEEILKVLNVKTDAEAITAITNMQTQIAVNKATVTRLETEVETLKTENAAFKESEITSDVDNAINSGKLLPKFKNAALAIRRQSKEDFDNFVKNTEDVPTDQLNPPKNPKPNSQQPPAEADFSAFLPGGE